jgi:hypothetical protein
MHRHSGPVQPSRSLPAPPWPRAAKLSCPTARRPSPMLTGPSTPCRSSRMTAQAIPPSALPTLAPATTTPLQLLHLHLRRQKVSSRQPPARLPTATLQRRLWRAVTPASRMRPLRLQAKLVRRYCDAVAVPFCLSRFRLPVELSRLVIRRRRSAEGEKKWKHLIPRRKS